MSATKSASGSSKDATRLPLLKPDRLREGDRVALIAPGSRPHNPASINRAVKLVEQLGFRPVVGKNVLNIHGFMAGTDAERLSDLVEAWRDDSIRGVFCLTGGYGVMHLLDKFDYDLAKKKPKIFVGSDDNNNLSLALYARAGLVSLHSPNLDRIVLQDAFQSLKEALTSSHPLPPLTASYADSGTGGADSIASRVSGRDAREDGCGIESLREEAAGDLGISPAERAAVSSSKGKRSAKHVPAEGSDKAMPPRAGVGGGSAKTSLPTGRLQVDYKFVPVGGRVEGPLVGGNLTALTGLMGTPFQPLLEGAILYLEDVNEHNDMLDRWFTTLYVSGVLKKVVGVAFGDFDNCGARDSYNLLSLEDLFGDRLKELEKPSCFGFPFGQSARSKTIPMGVRARLDAEAGTIAFLESALS